MATPWNDAREIADRSEPRDARPRRVISLDAALKLFAEPYRGVCIEIGCYAATDVAVNPYFCSAHKPKVK